MGETPANVKRIWRRVRDGGPIHVCDQVMEQGRMVWKPLCGLWAPDGYEKIDSPEFGRGTLLCRACNKRS